MKTECKCNKTYAEQKGERKFNWYKFLHQKKNYCFSHMFQAWQLAKNWTTCACGNQCKIIPRYEDGEPKDHLLNNLGINFYDLIDEMYYASVYNINYDHIKADALLVLDKIEARSKLIIKRILEKKSKSNKK